LNSVQLVGRLTKEVDLRFTQSGVAVGSFTVAIDRNYTNQQGERETDFIRCVIWRKSAENFANFTRKGSLVGVEGRIQTRSYDNQNGERVYITEVQVDNFHLLEPKSVTEQRPRETNPQGGSQGSGSSFNNDFSGGYNSGNNNFGGGSTSPNQNNYSGNSQPQYNGNNRQQQSTGNNFDTDFNSSPFSIDGGKDIDISQDDLPF
jgi:single-strand DNA-binding protein